MAALDDEAHLANTRRTNAEGLKFFETLCAEQGIEFVPSYANFVMVQVGDGQAVFEAMQRQGVITRPMAGYGLPEWIRLSIGTAAENQRAAEALKIALL
jgi:histidinol-phosphate aminotransferase